MNENPEQLLTTPEPVASVGNEPSGNADWDAAVQQAAETVPAVKEDAAPAEAKPEEAPAQEVDAPTTAPASDFTFATLQNGEQEVRLANGEVYRGKTDREVLEKIAASKIEANRYIQTLKNQPPPAAAPPPTSALPSAQEMDPTTLAIIDMIAPGFGVKSGQELIAKFQQLDQRQNEFGHVAEQAQLQNLAANFVRSTPDFVVTEGNAQKLESALDQYGLPPTMQNMQLVHNALKGQGVYEVVPQRAENGRFAPKNTMPPPPSGSAPAATTGKGTPTEADLWGMSAEALHEFLESASA